MKAISQSSSCLLQDLLNGPPVDGRVLGPRHLEFGGYVVSLTAPLAPRMPNGVECNITAAPGDHVRAGGGHLRIAGTDVEPGALWNPVPATRPAAPMPPGPTPSVAALAGLGPGLTPAGDDLLAGYVAGLVLLHGRRRRAHTIAADAAARTNALSATLLRHAALGEVPEPVHSLLATGDARPLLAFGHTSGQAWLRGLVSAGLEFDLARVA